MCAGLLDIDRGLVDLPKQTITDARDIDTDVAERFKRAFEADYDLKHFQLKGALADARDIVGRALALSWRALDNDRLTFTDAGYATCDALQEMGEGAVAEILVECLAWRDIINSFDISILGRNQRPGVMWT